MSPRPSPLVKRAMEWLAGAVARLAVGGVARMPEGVAARVGEGLGQVAYWLLRRRRRVAIENVSLALGWPADAPQTRRVVRKNFLHLGRTAVECCRLFLGPPGALLDRVRIEGLDHVKAALADGHGVLLLGGHIGNWELLAAAQALGGFSLHVVVRPLDNPHLERLLAAGRTRGDVHLIPKRRAAPAVRKALERGECVGIMLDQDAGRDGVFVPFLGRPASTSRGLAILALRTQAPVLPAFIRRAENGEHLVTIDAPVLLARTGDLVADIRENTSRFSAVLEAIVRAHPEQWFWVHRRWKTRPS